jgi:hypothetical protein
LATADFAAGDGFDADLRLALQAADSSIIPKTAAARLAIFQHWTRFCASFGHAPCLSAIADNETRLCYLLVFGLRVRRTGTTQAGDPVRADSVAKALLAVGAGITMLGAEDPRKQVPGAERNHPLLASFLKALHDEDDPAQRAYPANIHILNNLPQVRPDNLSPALWDHVCDLCTVGFFWMLRPAEYLQSASTGRSQAFTLADITFHTPTGTFAATDASLNDLDVTRLIRATLTFTDQKNAVKGEQISHNATTHASLCPVKALARICQHLRQHLAPAHTPLYAHHATAWSWNRPYLTVTNITPARITFALKRAAQTIESVTGISPKLLSSRSLRAGGATALLCAGVEADVIQLLGRWQSDAMLRYLRVAAHAHRTNFAQAMLLAGTYTFAPGTCTEHTPRPVPDQAPAAFITALQREALYNT